MNKAKIFENNSVLIGFIVDKIEIKTSLIINASIYITNKVKNKFIDVNFQFSQIGRGI